MVAAVGRQEETRVVEKPPDSHHNRYDPWETKIASRSNFSYALESSRPKRNTMQERQYDTRAQMFGKKPGRERKRIRRAKIVQKERTSLAGDEEKKDSRRGDRERERKGERDLLQYFVIWDL